MKEVDQGEPQTVDILARLLAQAKLFVHDAANMEVHVWHQDQRLILIEGVSRGVMIHDNPSHRWTQVSDVLSLRNIISFSTITSLSLQVRDGEENASQGFFESFPSLCQLLIHARNPLQLPTTKETLVNNLLSSPTACPKLTMVVTVCDVRIQDVIFHGLFCLQVSAGRVNGLQQLLKSRKAAGFPLRGLITRLKVVGTASEYHTFTRSGINE